MRWGVTFLLFFSGVVGQRRPNRYNGPPCNPRYYNCNFPPPLGGYPQGPSRTTYPQAIAVAQQFPPVSASSSAAAAASYQAYLASLQNPLPSSPPPVPVPVPTPAPAPSPTPAVVSVTTGNIPQYQPVSQYTAAQLQYSPSAGQYPPATTSSNPLYDVTPGRTASFIVPGGGLAVQQYFVPGSSPIAQYDPTFPFPFPFSTAVTISTPPPSTPSSPPTRPPTRPPTPPTVSPFFTTQPPTSPPSSGIIQYSPNPTANAVYIQCGTTEGPFRMRIEPDWAPIGAARFLSMVDQGFFNDISFFRVVPGFLVQFGIASAPDLNVRWQDPIKDDPHLPSMPFKRGMLSFAASGPNTRTSQLFIAFQDSTSLGTQPWETPFGQVDDMTVIDSIYSGYGDMQAFGGRGPDSSKISQYGNSFLRQQFPLLDYINFCQRVPSPAQTPNSSPVRSPPSRGPDSPTPLPLPVISPTTFPPTTIPPSPKPKPPTFPLPSPTPFPSVQAPTGKGKGKAALAAQTPNVPLPAPPTMRITQPPTPVPDPFLSASMPACDNKTCGSAIATDPAGTKIVCSCHENCVRDQNCCREFTTTCPKQFEASKNVRYPDCVKESCGKALMEGGIPLCSCHENCVNKKICCPQFMEICPAEYARAGQLAFALPAPTPAAPAAATFAPGAPKCTARDCTFAFMNGDQMLCSCAKGCEDKNNCCQDYLAVCVTAPVLPTCTEDVCGSEFRAKNSTQLLCSCHSSCVAANTCCNDMAEFCPDQLAQARHTAATALLAGASQSPPADRPKCNADTCGADFANDPAGKDLICSCYWQCQADGTCCDDFESACPDEFATAQKSAAPTPAVVEDTPSPPPTGKGKGGKAGKGKANGN